MRDNYQGTFLQALKQEPISTLPVWYMRQAGRYQPEYRKIREKYTLFEITHHPELCAKVTMLPVNQLNVDAAILFADIMTPISAIGIGVELKEGVGPIIEKPIRTISDLKQIRTLEVAEDIPYIIDSIKILKQELPVPLIGFAGAPFTLASYLIEGKPSRDYHHTKALMYGDEGTWFGLMDKIANLTINYIKGQITAGVDAVQLFDSWVGALNRESYLRYVFPVMEKIFAEIKNFSSVPIILFGVGAGHLLSEWDKLPIEVLGLDWRNSIREVRNSGIKKTLQGNLDPALLLAPWDILQRETAKIIDMGLENVGYIFNLGHGVFPEVKVETLQRLTEFVHQYSSNQLKSLAK